MRFKYLLVEGFKNLFKNKKATMISLVTMICAMFIFGTCFTVGQNVKDILKQIKEAQGMEVFIEKEATEEEMEKLGQEIRALDGVNSVVFKSRQEAINSFVESMKEYKEILEGYKDEETNPLRASYVVTLTELEKAKDVESTIEKLDNVANITSSNVTIEVLIKVANGIQIAIAVFFALLLVILITIISNTIKLTVHARRREISIMKYVGATNNFIRWPFVIEGMLIGLIAAIITLLIVGALYDIVVMKIQEAHVLQMMAISLLQFSEVVQSITIVYAILGVGVGILGSTISMKKYLEV